MSGPFRFNQQQDSRSPLDRPPPNLFPAGQPPSFKTNVNRSKTKKWVEAKPYSYDGDDWGDVDEYDEYGADQEPQPPPQPAAVAGLRQPGSRFEQSPRSFTDPQHQGFPQPARRNSFEAGEEHRAFSAGTHQPQKPYEQPTYGAPSQSAGIVHPAHRQASAAESDTSDTPQHRRDFLPAALPPPLQTKISPTPGSASGSPLNPKYPIRKSSIGQIDSPGAISPREGTPSNPTKPLPFIRPADIYKRVEEERQRERTASMDSSRPSLDSLSSRPREDTTSPGPDALGRSADPAKSLQPLETVSEGRSEYQPNYNAAAQSQQSQSQSDYSFQPPSLPQVRRISAFDNDFWSGDQQQQTNDGHAPFASPSDDQGFRSVVNQAFTRTDDQRSIPPTPISKSDSGMSRSNTESTSGISPIMSRVPSSATSALKNRNNAGGDTPMIAEEASESSTPVSRPTSQMLGGSHQIARKPSPTSHARDFSSSSQPRSGLATPSPGESPAHTPAIEPRTFVPESESALYSSLSPTSPDAMEGGMGNPSSAYATREADIASAIKLSPTTAVPELGAAEKESQTAFLASHQNADSPISDAAPRSRSESPNKGRVQELAGKFGDVSSRRGSTQSNASGNSIQSWEKSPEHSRPSSPTKPITTRPISPTKQTLDERPAAAREVSFRPKLPGQWESYATTNATPSDQGDRDMQISGDNVLTPDDRQVLSPLDEVDLTPTTAKHPVLATDPSKSPSSPSDALAALKAAGAAMGEAIQASVGLGASSSQSSQDREEQVQGNTYGDVYLSRPLQLDRTASSNSSIPPTPPAKDSPESEDLPPPPPLKEKSPEPFSSSSQEQTPVRPTPIPQLSTETSMHDQESDRLRKEIVASLTPLKTSDEEHNGPSLQPTVLPEANRASSILPSEYDSYWADGDHTSPRPSTDIGRNVSEHPRTSTEQSPVAARSTATEFADSTKPPVLDRHFSWEGNQAQIISPEGQAQTGADAQALKNPEEEKQVVSSTTQQATDNAPSHSFQGIPDPYFGPSHVTAVSKPDHVNESDIAMRSPTPPPNSEKPLASPTRADTVKEVSHATGLHVVNTEMNPEAVDMPPRLSAQTSLVSQQSLGNAEESAVSRQQESHEEATTAPVPDSVAGPSTTQDHDARSPTSDKPLGFREIVTMKSPSERIATYNKTRDYWANADHGLNDWIASAVAANPQLASQTPLQHRPTIAATATSRHKPAGSLSLFGKKEGSSSTQPPIAPYYEQYNSAASQVPSTPTSSGAPAEVHPQSSSTGASGGRSTSHQMQTKGKDLLHTAGVLGGKGLGKGMTSAKGLFAKGKSRFRASGSGDKVSRSESMSSSREASEEPELMTTPENTRMSTDFDGPKEQKKKRRMSSPFHRSSRSRSRPSSIVLPKNAHLDFGSGSTPRNTPPRETPPAEGSRPQSFHAPDSWDVIPDSHQQQQPTSYSTPPRGGGLQPPERLGVLPSPAKSAFSFLPQDRDGEDIPPVPPIPDGMEERQRGRESQESARQHRVIQSIVRYSTPPAMDLEASRLMDEATFKDTPAPPTMETGRLQPSPIFGDTPTGRDAIQPDAHSVQNDSLRVLALKQMDANHHSLQSDNNALPPRSMPTHEQMEEDDDDLPPQLSHEPPQPFHRAPDISPDFGPSVPQAGEISPVISSVGLGQMEESEEEDDDGITHLDHGSLMATSQHTKGDISPMIPAATLAVSSASDGPQTRVDNAIANGFSASRDVRLGYETEQIGAGDVSPVSSHAHHGVEETTPKKIIEAHASLGTANSRQTDKVSVGSDEAFSAPGASALLGGAQSLHESGSAGQTGGGAGVRLSASPYQVLHAVQYVPSRSSLDSWEQDSVVAPSQSDGSQLGDRHDERDIPPVPPLSPSMVQLEDKTPQQHYPEPEQPTFNFASSNISTKSHPLISEPAQQEAHPSSKAEAATSGSHNRSQSLLSIISSMVPGDGVSISSASSQAGRSRPSSANRQQGSSAKSSPIPAQIIEESIPGEQRSMTVPISDDYDLYADQNGIVKDVQDEKGQPLRVAAAPVADTPEPKQKAVLGAARMTAVPKIREEDTRRYSDERPMSFISGPRDANGRPQDEISTPGSGAAQANIPPVPRIPSHQLQGHPQAKTNETLYASTPPQHEPQPKEEQQQQHFPGGVVRRQTVSPIHSSMRSEQVRTPPHSNVSPPPPSNASPPPQPSPPPALAHRPLLDEIRMQSPIQIPPLQDPRLRSPPMQDLRFQSPPMQDPRLQSPPMQDPRFQSPPVQDPRFQSPPLQDPRLQSAHLQGPRMQSPPAQDPRIQVARLQNPPTWDPSMQDPRIQDPRSPQDPKKWDPRLIADPQRQGITSGQPNLQGPRGQTQKPKQSYNTMPRMGMPRLGGASTGPPRNQYELQQQQMQHQAMDPRLNDAEYRPPAAQANTQPAKQENKGSSRPKFASVLKSLGGKSNPSAPQTSQQPTSRVDPSHSVPEGPIRSASYQSSLGDLPTEQGAPKKERRASAFGSLSSRPKSVGTESHFSQDSTRVQAADSRLDLRYPISPAPFKGIPPQQVHQGVPLSQPPQAQRISTSAVPENGKKKRFSSLGNLFSRSGTSGQSKLSKEEKKFQKTQKHSTMPQFQTPPPSQQWPQQQQPFRPQQYTLQYGPPPPAATRPFPGMQGIAPQSLSPQTMSPMSPQGGHPQGMPPRIMQPQNYQQQHQQQIPQQIPQQITQQMQQQMPQQMPPQPQVQQQQSMTNGSAYIATRQIAQTHPSQRPTRQSSQPPQISNPGIPAPNPSFEHPMHRSETTGHAPPAGYYKPDSKRMGSEHAAPSFTAVERQQPLQRQSTIPQPPANLRSVSSPSPDHVPQAITPVSQRRVSSPLAEPQYETPEIPAAYNHVAGVYTSPSTQALSHDSQATRPSPVQNGSASGRQYSDPEMQPISPQVSEQTQMAPNERNQSNSSVASVVSPISNPSPGMSAPQPASNQRPQKARMTSITEAAHQERPWNLNVREGATEQEIVRARHQQYMEQQLAAQQQLHAERTGQSPSPRPSHQSQSPSPRPPSNQQQAQQPPPSTAQGSDGFREVLPKSSPQPYPMSQAQRQSVSNHLPREQQQSPAPSVSPHQLQQSHLHPEQGVQPAAYPLPTSPVSAGPRSPVNPLAAALPPPPPPPPKLPHSPMRPAFHMNQFPAPDHQQQMEQQQQQYQPPHPEQQIEQPDYEQQPPDEPPPSYSGPGVPNEGMDKDRPRPPNIMTDAEIRGRENNGRQRQPSIGLLQHPQPASMAASPQRSSADMGADNLRRQLLEQEERALAERLQRAEIQRAETERERQERERARARARELERSVSGGGRVGSLRSVAGSGRGGWERRGSTARPVFELPAEEDDEPVMRATSFPGQEWVPQWTED